MRSLPLSTPTTVLGLGLLALAALAQDSSSADAKAALAPTGVLRAVFLATNPMQGRVDRETGEVSGIAADLAHEIGRRLDVVVEITPTPGVPAVMDAVASGAADIGFLAYAAPRAERVDFAQIYVLGHNSYIVRAESPIRTLRRRRSHRRARRRP